MLNRTHDLPPLSDGVGSASARPGRRLELSVAPRSGSLTSREWERANRLGLLLIHSFVGLFAGLLILFNGTATAFDGYGSWPRYLTGGLALTGGAVLLSGLAGRPRLMLLECAGLAVLGAWDLVMTAGFVIGAVRDEHLTTAWPWQSLPQADPIRLYPIVLYVGLFLMISVHLLTLQRIRQLRG